MQTLSFYSCLTQSFGLISLSEFPFLVVFSHQFMSNSLWPHGLKHARLPCPPLFPRVCSNLCSLSQWCHPTISSSSALFSCCLQSFPASGSFPTSWLFASGGQSFEASTSTSMASYSHIGVISAITVLLAWCFSKSHPLCDSCLG